jgi:hypothetical protein
MKIERGVNPNLKVGISISCCGSPCGQIMTAKPILIIREEISSLSDIASTQRPGSSDGFLKV